MAKAKETEIWLFVREYLVSQHPEMKHLVEMLTFHFFL